MTHLPLYPIDQARPLPGQPGACTRCKLGREAGAASCAAPRGSGSVLALQSSVATTGGFWGGRAERQVMEWLRTTFGDDVVFDHAVRCSTTSADDLDEAVTACRPFLREVLDDRRPRLILAFGRGAAQAVVGTPLPPTRNLRRGWARLADGTVVVFFPALGTIARNAVEMRWVREDIEWAASFEPPATPVFGGHDVVRTVADAQRVEAELAGKLVVLDTETMGAMSEPDFRVVALAVCDVESNRPAVWPADALEPGDPRRDVLLRLLKNVRGVAGHNLKYDLSAVAWGLGVEFPPGLEWVDTYLWAKQLRPDGVGGLDDLGWHVGWGGHKAEMQAALAEAGTRLRKLRRDVSKPVVVTYVYEQRTGPSGKTQRRKVPTLTRDPSPAEKIERLRELTGEAGGLFVDRSAALGDDWTPAVLAEGKPEIYTYGLVDRDLCMRYCAQDVAATAALVRHYRAELLPEFRALWDSYLSRVPWAISQVERWGVAANKTAMHVLERDLQSEINAALGQIHAHAPGLEPGSNLQLADLLYRQLKLKPPSTTDKGAPSVDSEALAKLAGAHPVIPAVREYRKLEKLRGTYAVGMASHVRSDGRIRTSYNLAGTETGRISSNDPNMQNIPSRGSWASRVKDVIQVEPGRMLVQLDYSTLEMRVAAMLSGDPAMIKIFQDGEDPHRRTAELVSPMLWGSDFATCGGLTGDVLKAEQKRRRSVCKWVNFGCVSMDTEVLTRRGWVTYDGVGVGDEVLGRTGWVKVTDKVFYPVAPVVDWQGFRVTPNHRWWSWTRARRGKASWQGFTTLSDATTEHNIQLAIPQRGGPGIGGADRAALLAWLVTDGHVSRQHRRACIHQSSTTNPDKVREIDELLARAGVEATRTVRPSGIMQWSIHKPVGDGWVDAALGVDEDLVLRMTTEERAAFVRAGLLAEGHRQGGRWRFTQNAGRVANAFRLAFYLEGYFVRTTDHGTYNGRQCERMVLSKGHVTGQRLSWVDAGAEAVWCLRTEDETFTMRRDGRIALTGNTAYGQSAVTLADMAGISEREAEQAQDIVMGRFPDLRRWIQRVTYEARQTGATWSYWNGQRARRRWVPAIGSADSGEQGHGERQAFNTPVQGTGHEYCLASAVRAVEWIRSDGPDAKLVVLVHDSLVFDAAESDVAEVAEVVRGIMEGWPTWRDVPIKADVEVGRTWGRLEPYEEWSSRRRSAQGETA